MKLKSTWTGKMRFSAEAGELSAAMDAKPPIGEGTAFTPKELVLAALCGCTGMDVVALMKKHKQPLESFELTAEASTSDSGHPVVFREVSLLFDFKGDLNKEKVLESVRLSQTKYCSVSAMLTKAFPINYVVHLNAETIGSGKADFNQGDKL